MWTPHALTPLQRILVCGWGEAAFMASVLRELDHGPAALPAGSEVVLFNQHDPPDQLPSVRRRRSFGSAAAALGTGWRLVASVTSCTAWAMCLS